MEGYQIGQDISEIRNVLQAHAEAIKELQNKVFPKKEEEKDEEKGR